MECLEQLLAQRLTDPVPEPVPEPGPLRAEPVHASAPEATPHHKQTTYAKCRRNSLTLTVPRSPLLLPQVSCPEDQLDDVYALLPAANGSNSTKLPPLLELSPLTSPKTATAFTNAISSHHDSPSSPQLQPGSSSSCLAPPTAPRGSALQRRFSGSCSGANPVPSFQRNSANQALEAGSGISGSIQAQHSIGSSRNRTSTSDLAGVPNSPPLMHPPSPQRPAGPPNSPGSYRARRMSAYAGDRALHCTPSFPSPPSGPTSPAYHPSSIPTSASFTASNTAGASSSIFYNPAIATLALQEPSPTGLASPAQPTTTTTTITINSTTTTTSVSAPINPAACEALGPFPALPRLQPPRAAGMLARSFLRLVGGSRGGGGSGKKQPIRSSSIDLHATSGGSASGREALLAAAAAVSAAASTAAAPAGLSSAPSSNATAAVAAGGSAGHAAPLSPLLRSHEGVQLAWGAGPAPGHVLPSPPHAGGSALVPTGAAAAAAAVG
ncbi:hypothetical protein Agub_g12155, partial [Astrephomene gubernaculifera]